MNNMGKKIPSKRISLSGTASLAAVSVLVLGLASCGDSSSTPTPTPTTGGSITVGIFDTLPGFCVGNNPANSALMATRTIYETLFEKTEDGEMSGLLAESARSSDDLKTWTVTLRQGITFHDGTPFDAAAVVFNFNAITGRIALGAYASNGLAGLSAQSHTIGTGTAFTANIVSFTATNEYEVQFNLDRPQYDFASTLYASGRFFMRSPAQLADATKCAQTPIGTGPFKFSSWKAEQLVVVKNADYWREDPSTGAQLPYLDKITFTNVKETSQRAAAVRSATLDASFFSSATDGVTIKDLRNRTNTVSEYKSSSEYYPSLWLNQGKPNSPFSYLSARQAVLSCLDRENFVAVRTQGETDIATSIVGSQSLMYSTKGFPEYSVTDSKNFVATYTEESGKSNLSFVFPVDTSTASQANARFLKNMWANCGIDADYVIEETANIIAKAFNASPQIDKGQYYNAYDAILFTLLEGEDAAFNTAFLVTNAYSETSTNPVQALFKNSLGPVLGLNHHSDTAIDKFFYDGQAAKDATAARNSYQAGTEYLQANAVMGSLYNFYYALFTTKSIGGVGSLRLPDGSPQRQVTNWGIDWTGVYKAK
jgi:ABC-type transport system substrate-binding protein